MKKNSYRKNRKITAFIILTFASFFLSFHFNLSSRSINFHNSEQTSFIQQIHADKKEYQQTSPEKFAPNVDFLQKQWNLNLMNIGEAWADGYNGKGIKIAVLDTGFYHKHPDIVLAGGDSVFSDEAWSVDHSGHGTHIAGIISAKSGTNYQGVAPAAEVYGIKIYHSDDMNEFGDVSTDVNSVITGIRLAIEKKVDIIVISSGLNYHDEGLYNIIKEAHEKNIMIIAASGNGNQAVNYPASYSEVIAVTAIDEDLNPALDIIYGQENEFSAPGVNIGGLSIPDSSYSYPYIFMSGSSQATPHVAGLAAIFMQKYDERGEKIREIMQEQAIDIGDPGLFGQGLLYYQSNKTTKEKKDNKIEPSSDEHEEKKKEKNEDTEDTEARKPSSSRAADKEENEDELSTYKKIKVNIEGGKEATIDGEGFPAIEMGGRLDVFMRGASSLKLNENQISDIRQKNLTLVLRNEGIYWKIPPANFVPGQANLRFYKGQPIGTRENPNSYSNIYTASIFQANTRQGIYPGWMEVGFNLDKQKMPDPSQLDAAYFNKEKTEWLDLEKELDGDRLLLKTKNTGALGFFELEEELIEEDESEKMTVYSPALIIIFVGTFLTLALAATKKWLTKRKS